jgi:hypothetical protein
MKLPGGQEDLVQQVFNKSLKKIDIIIILTVIIISLLIFYLFSNQSGNSVEVYVSGNIYATYPLYDKNEIEINTNKGNITINIDYGKVCVLSSDCSDGECIKQGHISGKNKSLICLPLETVIKIGEDDYEIAY